MFRNVYPPPLPPSFRSGLCSAMLQKQPLPPSGGSVKEIFIHTYTHVQTGIIRLIRSRVDCSPKAGRVGGSGATALGCCTSVSLGGLGSLGSLEPVMLPVSATQSSSLSTADFIGQCVGCREVFNQLSCRGGLDLMSVFPSLDCCVCVCVCEWLPAFAVKCDLRWSLWFTLCSLLLLV